jgi:hypothetical protein
MMGSPPNLYVAVKPWLDADPEGAFEWLFDPANESREDALSQLDADRDPATMERIVRGLAKSGSESCSKYLVTLYRRDPELATSLADELSIPLREDASLEEIRLVDHPAEACDRWLAALREHGDPAEALASLGWTPEMAVALAAQAARAFPEKARQLAKLVPASSLDATNLWRRNNEEIALYWPELKGALKYPEPKSTGPVVPEHLFRYDPAAAAKLIEADPEKGMVESLVKYWAPYDLPAARDWLVRLPEGPARQQGELALAKFLASADPEAALGLLDRLPADASSHQQWEPAIRRLLYAGGDWQRWLARIPGDDRQWLADELAREAKVIEVARRPPGR